MWHEARKQERRIRGLIVDYRKRAERRQDFYEKIQADPTQFIQIHGRRCKIHLDPAVAAAGDGAAIIVPWQGQQDNLIDRFDVRAHLDHIAVLPKNDDTDDEDISQEERQFNYERYRILAQNDFLNLSEEKFLHQLFLEEQFGANAQLEAERNLGKKKQPKTTGATIGYSYDDASDAGAGVASQPFIHLMNVAITKNIAATIGSAGDAFEKNVSDDSDSDIDMDVSIDIGKLDTTQAHELNACGRNYGMKSNDFYSFLTKDADEADALRIAREEEQEKMLLSGRKSRRERRAQKERRIASRPFSPPSYAAKEEKGKKDNEDESDSRSPSPAEGAPEKITYITSFGGDDELQPHSKISINITKGVTHTLGESCISASHHGASKESGHVSYAQKVKDNLEKLKQLNESSKRSSRRTERRSRTHSRSHSRRRQHSTRHGYYRRSRSNSRRRYRSRSRSSSHAARHRRSRSCSRSRRRYNRSSSSASSAASPHHRGRSNIGQIHGKRRGETRTNSKQKSSSPPPLATVTKPIEIKPEISTLTTTSVDARPVLSLPPMISYPLPRISAATTSISTAKSAATLQIEPPPPPLKRYYGRKRGEDSSSSIGDNSSDSDTGARKSKPVAVTDVGNDSDERVDVDTTSERSNPLQSSTSSITGNQTGKYCPVQTKSNPSHSNATEIKGSGTSIGAGNSRPNLRERLKRKMQNLLNRQYKADKRAEIEKSERERQIQQEREDEMRELALKLRKRQRELRHKYGTPSSGKGSGSDHSEPACKISKSAKPSSKSRSRERSFSERTRRREQSRSRERDRGRSHSHGSRSQKLQQQRRTASRDRRRRSRSRRSQSHRRRRSKSVVRKRERDNSHEPSTPQRYGSERSRYRRSRSRHDRERERRDRYAERDKERDRDRFREHERDHDRERQKEMVRKRGGGGGALESRPSTSDKTEGGSNNRGRVVISAPPKLKKLVDY